MCNGIAAWFDRLTMSGWVPHDDSRLRISPSLQPSPIEGEGEGPALAGVDRDWRMSSQVGGLGCWSMAVLIADSNSDTRRRSRNNMRLAKAGLASAMRSSNT